MRLLDVLKVFALKGLKKYLALKGLESLCFERAWLQPRRKRPIYNVALATEGMLIHVSRPGQPR